MLVARKNNDLMSTMFNELLDWNRWNGLCSTEDQHMTPKMNVSESDKDYRLELCIPGMKKEDLSLSIDTDNNIDVCGDDNAYIPPSCMDERYDHSAGRHEYE